ncbi:citrate synthase [Paractinoplanes ferrugineus]|uniref:citrate synthase (unknown stereospecificity) n=1 Tax=Paractinoplanes ferrugineus TaxID=113564 RepID=A0A919J4W8_9ACTN|nr:citrate synthase [Actinoplanes ferrugineus]GIE13063.1 citrate synthase [Actinoplanes ferrugineus]
MEPHLLTTDQVAERLGVKPATVYAYVSRGMLTSRRNADGKGSLFEKPEVDAFVAGRRRTTTPGIRTGLTLIEDGRLFYRGHDACELARTASFESVVTLLWTGELTHAALEPQPELLELATRAVAVLPSTARLTDRLRVIVAATAAADPLRFDTSPPAVVATGRAMLATMPAAFGTTGGIRPAGLAATLWPALTASDGLTAPNGGAAADRGAGPAGGTGSDSGAELLNAALVLLADHDMAASTLAARVAASTRANPYAVVSAGLAALDGPFHGAASGLVHAMLREALAAEDPIASLTDRQRAGRPIPGFGHTLYPDGDPRATTLLAMIGDGPVRETAERLVEAMRTRSGVHPNVDFPLAVLALTHGMPAEAGEAVFAVGRTAGWLAHALEEYADKPLRFRPSGLYDGRPPGP